MTRLKRKKYFIFGEGGGETLAAEFNIPLLAQLPLLQGISENSDYGTPVAVYADGILGKAYTDLSEKIAQHLAIQMATK